MCTENKLDNLYHYINIITVHVAEQTDQGIGDLLSKRGDFFQVQLVQTFAIFGFCLADEVESTLLLWQVKLSVVRRGC